MVHGGVLGRWVVAVVVAGAFVVGAGGCGSSSHMNLSGPTTVPVGSSTTVSATADDGQEAAILAAYRGSLADFNQVEDTAPVNADSPLLGDHMAGAKLSTVMSALSQLARAGQVASGQIQSLHANVSQFNGTQAVVVSCEVDRTSVVNATTHDVVAKATDATELVNELVTLEQGSVWKVTVGNRVSPGCS